MHEGGLGMAAMTGSRVDETMRPGLLTGALCAGAGVIHVMMAPVHASASQAESLGFAIAGWFQLALAALLIFKPSKQVYAIAGIGNAVILAAWVWSRTKGLPVGSNPWQPEDVGTVDLTSAVFEAGVVVGSLAQFLPRPAVRMPMVVSAIGAVAVAMATSMVLVSPQTADHHGGETADAQLSSASTRCDASLNPVAYWNEARLAGTDGTAPMGSTAAMGSDHHGAATPSGQGTTATTSLGPLKGRGSEQLDKLLQLAATPGEVSAGFAVAEFANATDAEYEEFIRSLNPASGAGHTPAPATGSGAAAGDHSMGHLGPQQWTPMTDTADCDQVRAELAKAKAVADRYPTAESAMADGYVRVAPYVPGIASHWMKFSYVDGTFDVNEPEMLLYDGNGPEAHLTGLSYYVTYDGDSPPTQGFTGNNDLYHRHLGLCTSRTGGVIGDSTTTDAECEALGGKKSNGGSGWMSHAWVVPGCESPWGVFSGINPLLDTQLGQQSGTNDGGCAGSAVRQRYDLQPGSPETMPSPITAPVTESAAGP